MLRLEKMQISGFKSFSDRTEVSFPGGITGVVGPNGCGKSNIGDAINWVLGEQSPRNLRGQQMADVIFSGTQARKPLGMAEVSLHLGGADGLEGAEEGRIVVTRRLFRSGESDYLLNGRRARLKDIQDVLNLARVGQRSYATIEQGKIDQILNAKPKDRRQIIEDAAGIAGYKHKRRLTELKLDATRANLLRVNDIIVEVQRQIRALKRQAAKARRYRKLRDALRERERVRFAARAQQMDQELRTVRAAASQAADAEAQAAATLGRLELRSSEAREALDRSRESYRRGTERLHTLEIEIEREEAQIAGCREKMEELREQADKRGAAVGALAARRDELQTGNAAQLEVVNRGRQTLSALESRLADCETALEQAERELRELRETTEALRRRQFDSMNLAAELRNRRRSLEDRREQERNHKLRLELERETSLEEGSKLESESSRLAEERHIEQQRHEQATQAAADADRRLAELRQREADELEALAQVREREKSAVARRATLEDVATRFAGVSDGVRTLLSSAETAGVHTAGIVADFIEAGAGVEAAAEGYLRAFLPTVIVENDDDIHRAAELLRSVGAGRTSLVCRSQPVGRPAVGQAGNGSGELPPELRADARVSGRLSERLKLRASVNGVVQQRLGDAVLVSDLHAALDLHRRYPAMDYITARGDVVYASGVVSTGGNEGDQGLLAHRRRMDEARREAAEASGEVGQLQERIESTRREVGTVESGLRGQRERCEAAGRRVLEIDMRLKRSTDDRERTGRRAGVLEEELAVLQQQIAEGERALIEVADEVSAAERSHRDVEQALERQAGAEQELELRVRSLAQQASQARADRAAMQERQDASENEARRLEESLTELVTRLQALERETAEGEERSRATASLREETERSLMAHLEERKRLAAQVTGGESELAGLQEAVEAAERELRGSRQGLDTLRESSRQAELERTRAESARTHLDELCQQELGISASEAIRLAQAADTDLQAVDAGQLDEEVQEIKRKLEQIGPVNMTAIEEFTELEERDAFLGAQRQDLEQAMASLKDSIRRIDRSSRERFLQAFEAIRKSYQEIFGLLFNGGRADLRLEEGEDVLECGIEIMVQPPGKRLGNIRLMSGGEKALSAIALLFAVFRFQPSPFCLLDEVDAALDDANVGRFARMVTEYAKQTQFIVITHNKLSMECADLLYGVTMEEAGVSKLVSLQLQ